MSNIHTDKKPTQTVKRNSNGRFALGNAGGPGRPAGASCRALLMAREAAEHTALPMLIEAAQDGDWEAAKILLAYGLPRQKPVAIPEAVPLPDGSLTEKMSALLAGVAQGSVSASLAGEVASLIATAAKVDEVEQLTARVEELLERLDRIEGSGR